VTLGGFDTHYTELNRHDDLMGYLDSAVGAFYQDLAAHGMAGAGSLHAAMLDARATFDALVREQAPSPEAAERILRNPIYEQLAGAVAGSHEYMAMERLYEVWASGRYDLIVLDTPPSRHALDFLEAPGRVTRFVDGRALRLLVRPGMRAGRLGLRASWSTMMSRSGWRRRSVATMRRLNAPEPMTTAVSPRRVQRSTACNAVEAGSARTPR